MRDSVDLFEEVKGILDALHTIYHGGKMYDLALVAPVNAESTAFLDLLNHTEAIWHYNGELYNWLGADVLQDILRDGRRPAIESEYLDMLTNRLERMDTQMALYSGVLPHGLPSAMQTARALLEKIVTRNYAPMATAKALSEPSVDDLYKRILNNARTAYTEGIQGNHRAMDEAVARILQIASHLWGPVEEGQTGG